MALNKEESSKIGYKAKIEWYKQRYFDISDGKLTLEQYLEDTKKDFEAEKHTPEELISILDDLSKKASKLEGKIAFLSTKLSIPVDQQTQKPIYDAVRAVDPGSGGNSITYELYDKLLREQEVAYNSVNLDFMINNTTGDANSDSVAIRNQILSNYPSSGAGDNSLQRYTNRWLNNLLSWNEHDYQVSQILNFADNYLSIFPDPAYIPWSMRREVGAGRIDARSLSDVMKYFSADYASRVQDMVTGIEGFKNLQLDYKIEGVTARYINYLNKFLNQVNYTFDIDFAMHLVCCFMQWGIKMDLKTLKGLRAMLQLLQTGLTFDFNDVLNGIKDVVNNIFRGLLCNQLVSLITYIMQSLVDPLKRWLNDPEDKNWNTVFACTPIRELLQKYVTEAMDYLEELLNSLVNNWYKKIEIENIKNTLKIEWKNNSKIMGELAQLLDWIIYATEAAAKCGINNSPDSEPVSRVLKDYKIESPQKYVFPVEENPTIWNSFISQDSVISQDSGTAEAVAGVVNQIKPLPNSTIGYGTNEAKDNTPFDECLKNIPKENIAGVREWIDLINAKSQGSV